MKAHKTHLLKLYQLMQLLPASSHSGLNELGIQFCTSEGSDYRASYYRVLTVMQPTLGWPGFQHSARSLQLSAKSDADKYLRDYAKLAADVLQMAAWSLGETPPNTEGDENNSSCANLDFSNRLLSPNTASLRLQKHELCGALRILIPDLIPM
jgi:hypothetical protein